MSTKERTLLLKLNEQIKKLSQPPLTTFSPQTGVTPLPTVYNAATTPLTPLPPIKH